MELQLNNPPKEITILEGQAPLPPKDPLIVDIKGDINTVKKFLDVRKQNGHSSQSVSIDRALIIVDKKEMSILLLLDPENYYGAKVKGTLELSDELKLFSINQNKTFTREELVKLLRFNKLYFDNPDKHAELLKAYLALNIQAIINSQQESDQRGNKKNEFLKSVSTNVPAEFILNIPIFKGQESRVFRVEICLDITDGGARFWFESVELHELIETVSEVIFNEQLKDCQSFVIVNK